MFQGFKVIDADAHMQEPYDIWSDFVEPEFFDRRPLVAEHESRTHFYYAPCEIFPEGTKKQRGLGARVMPEIQREGSKRKYPEAWEAYYSPESRLYDMDRYGWDKMVLIPGSAAGVLRVEGKDQALMWAVTRAYNNWAHSFASADPSRLKMVCTLPNQHDIEGLVQEVRRCVETLNALAVDMPKAPANKWWHDPEYDNLWATAVDLDVPIAFHGVPSGDAHTASRYNPLPHPATALNHAIGFPFENMISVGHLIYMGILERFPKLKISALEGNAGWLPFWLERLNDHAIKERRQGVWWDTTPLALKPSEYFMRQGFVACDGDEGALKYAVDYTGGDRIVWNTDYPHFDGPDPDKTVSALLDQPISEEAKRKILWDNPVALYGDRILS